MDVVGVYCFDMSKGGLLKKSSGYSVYSELFGDGVYWTPLHEFQVGRFLAGDEALGKITAGDQWVCKNDQVQGFGFMYHCTALL